MDFDFDKSIDAIKDGIKEVADYSHDKISSFHKNYVSKILPDCGKYGDAAKFAAELAPGVSEYNAIKEGNWKEFAIAAGVDIGAIAVGAFTAGAGYAAVKGGSVAAKAGVKVATKEVAEAGAKKAIKETAETGAKKATKESVEGGAEKAVKETAEANSEKVVKEVAEEGTEKAEKSALKVGDKIDKKLFPNYLDEIESITGREIPSQQRQLIEKALKENDYVKLSNDEWKTAKKQFNYKRKDLIEEWERKTGKEWPEYAEDVVNEEGTILRKAGQPYDAHHVIEQTVNGPNEWWNLHPARYPDQHQGGIHGAGKLASNIFE